MPKPIERDVETEPDVLDYETACAIMADIQDREGWSMPRTLAQWVASIRAYGYTERDFD